MKSLYADYKTNDTAEVEGIWMTLGETDDGQQIAVKVKRAGGENSEFEKAMTLGMKPYRLAIQAGNFPSKKMVPIIAKAYAKTVLVDWKNVADEDGNPMDFTIDNATKLLTDLPVLLDRIAEFASDMRSFRDAEREEDAKNL